ncbi:UTP--glucose-1-phosphate uridylyltransferase [Tepidimonas thermarum]|uniref:UTP--glucose-1-phosphate uridylyltransferase n=1 Tax=Tepidimonas thermarum TaxID=335431 RepID=A0A554X489_9BURK|nr:nucleotidyltransferase family protein [Tepidimonas thermarum]TSE30628.1 UTP--glucose-1-phosphate uridylyltransferase [Tepidimonas thermarum]
MPERSLPRPDRAEALLLAAGRGERMRPLTDTCPKPLLPVRGRPLLAWHLDALARAGVRRVLINTAWLGEQIPAALGTVYGQPPQALALHYSMEGQDFGRALETAGGIARALPWLQDVFWLAAGDVYMPGFGFDPAARARFAASDALAHLWLVPNPPHHPRGDFGLGPDGRALDLTGDAPAARWTYATVALLRRALFEPPWCDIPPGNPAGVAAPLAPLLRRAMAAGRVTAEVWHGDWTDVGTPERWAALNAAAPDAPTAPPVSSPP